MSLNNNGNLLIIVIFLPQAYILKQDQPGYLHGIFV